MAGRALAFSDPTVIALASERFIPVAENCSPLQSQQDAKGDFFRLVAEQGHYAGRTYPTSTRQGYYAFTADGRVLAAVNSRDPRRMTEMMENALRHWNDLVSSSQVLVSPAQNGSGTKPETGNAKPLAEAVADYVPARPSRYPEGGLVLRQAARDLPREEDTRKDDWRKDAWNLDYAWFTPDEARSLVPEPAVLGARKQASREIVRRIARFHLRDFVRGEPSVWPEEALRHGELTAEVVDVTDGQVRLTLRGTIRLQHEMRWVRPENGEERRSDCGFNATLAGEAVWDEPRGAFTQFDLVAAGSRWGTNQYNNRADDLGPAPLGIAFTLAGSEPRDRTPPHTIYHRAYFDNAR